MSPPVKSKAARSLARYLIEHTPVLAAQDLETFSDKEAAEFLAGLQARQAAPVAAALTPVKVTSILDLLPKDMAGAVLAEMDPARAAALAMRLEKNSRDGILQHMSAKKAAEIKTLGQFPEGTAGSMMDSQVMAFHPDMKAGDVLKQLRKLPHKNAREVFLVDGENRLCGSVPLQSLAVAEPSRRMEELKGPDPLEVLGVASSNEVMDSLTQSSAPSVVVLDVDRRLLGVIRRDSLIQAAMETASADVQAMVGAGKEERALSSPWLVVRKRLPWLMVNLATAFLAAAVVGLFESTIAKFTALAVLLPVVAGQSGNTGAQALAVTMRGLALREVRVSQALRVCFKELRAGFLNGMAVAVVTAAAVFAWSRSPGLSLVIILSMIVSMMAAAFAGAMIPMMLTVLRQDPAQSSSIVLTTVTDVVGFLSFLGIATLLSSMI